MNILRKILVTGISATIILLIVLAVRASADANITGNDTNSNSGRRVAIVQAIQNNDYNAWVTAMTEKDRKPEILNIINADNFSKYIEMMNDFKGGKFAEAKKLSDELGISDLNTFKHSPKDYEGKSGDFKNSAVMQAIQNKDYNAWVAALTANGKNPKILEKINVNNFGRFTEMLQLVKDGKKDDAKVIADELGLSNPQPGIWKGRPNEGANTETQN